MAGTLAGWPGQVVRVRAVSRAGDPSRAQVTLGAGRPEVGGSVEKYVLELLMIFRKSFHNIRHLRPSVLIFGGLTSMFICAFIDS